MYCCYKMTSPTRRPDNTWNKNIIIFHRKKSLGTSQYSLLGNDLHRVNTISDLGVIFDSALSFDPHLEMIIAKSVKSLGFIKRSRTDFRSAYSIISLLKALVLPIICYGSVSGRFIPMIHSKNLKQYNTGW